MKQQFEYKTFEIKSVDYNNESTELIIEGYASNFGNKDEKQLTYIPDAMDYYPCQDIVNKGAFKKTLSERKGRIAFCKNHDIEDAKGKILEIKEDEIGLFVRIRISDAEPELKTKIREEIYTEFSIGFKTIKATYEKTKDGYIRNILEVKLYEVSIVTIARNDKSKITDIKSMQMVDTIINEILAETKSEKIHNKLLQLKSLLQGEPNDYSLDDPKPTDKKTVDVFEFNFK